MTVRKRAASGEKLKLSLPLPQPVWKRESKFVRKMVYKITSLNCMMVTLYNIIINSRKAFSPAEFRLLTGLSLKIDSNFGV